MTEDRNRHKSGASSSLSSRSGATPEVGPITKHEEASSYLRRHRIPQMFESMIAGLMIEMPKDHFGYMDKRLEQIKEKGVHFVNWETFVHHLHPRRDPVHLKMIHDPKYDKTLCLTEPKTTDIDVQPRLEREESFYKPDVFKLTETTP